MGVEYKAECCCSNEYRTILRVECRCCGKVTVYSRSVIILGLESLTQHVVSDIKGFVGLVQMVQDKSNSDISVTYKMGTDELIAEFVVKSPFKTVSFPIRLTVGEIEDKPEEKLEKKADVIVERSKNGKPIRKTKVAASVAFASLGLEEHYYSVDFRSNLSKTDNAIFSTHTILEEYFDTDAGELRKHNCSVYLSSFRSLGSIWVAKVPLMQSNGRIKQMNSESFPQVLRFINRNGDIGREVLREEITHVMSLILRRDEMRGGSGASKTFQDTIGVIEKGKSEITKYYRVGTFLSNSPSVIPSKYSESESVPPGVEGARKLSGLDFEGNGDFIDQISASIPLEDRLIESEVVAFLLKSHCIRKSATACTNPTGLLVEFPVKYANYVSRIDLSYGVTLKDVRRGLETYCKGWNPNEFYIVLRGTRKDCKCEREYPLDTIYDEEVASTERPTKRRSARCVHHSRS